MLLGMYRVALSDEQRHELRQRTRHAGLAPSTRDRLEMVRLSDAGGSVPRSARHLGQHEQTVRAWIKAFLAGGFEALPNKPRGGKPSALTAALLESVRAEGARGGRTWTAAQLADWIAEHHGVRLSADRLRRPLHRARISWQRTSRTLRHTQDPQEVAERQAVLMDLEKRGRPA
jgi:transposase